MDPAPKPRIDSWYAPLTEAQRWDVYEKALHLPWAAAAEYAAKKHGLAAAPGRSAFYRFLDWMRPQESARRLASAALAGSVAAALAGKAGAKKEVAEAFVAMGSEIALRTGDAAAAKDWLGMAASLLAAAAKDREIELRAEAQKLDREKFEAAERRLAQASETVKDESLTPEQQVAKMKEIFGIHG